MTDHLPPAAYAASLAGFSNMSVHRLAALLRHHTPAEAFAIATGLRPAPRGGLVAKVLDQPEVRDAWSRSARSRPPEAVWCACVDLGVEVSVIGDPAHPALDHIEPLPPPVLFSRGDRRLLTGRRVALVGTRNATAAGRHLARTFGEGLAGHAVHVVSGLARGIDAEAHSGVLRALDARFDDDHVGRPIAVVASGLDVVYPREHRAMWAAVAQRGLLLSEHPPGSEPTAYRFPQRNRLVASLSEIVVVIESRERGGSLITASLAAEHGVPVMAVPGSAANRAASGANELLRDGSAPALDVHDILMALGLDHARAQPQRIDHRLPPAPHDVAVYQECQQHPRTIGALADLLDRTVVEIAMSVARLEQRGWLTQADGWFEATGSPFP